MQESVCHERAHIIVGIEHGHDEVWETEYELLKQLR
jgi:hypothetical protein